MRRQGAPESDRHPGCVSQLADPVARADNYSTADRQKATVKVRVTFDKLDPRILPDMGVKVGRFWAGAAPPPTGNEAAAPKALIRAQRASTGRKSDRVPSTDGK